MIIKIKALFLVITISRNCSNKTINLLSCQLIRNKILHALAHVIKMFYSDVANTLLFFLVQLSSALVNYWKSSIVLTFLIFLQELQFKWRLFILEVSSVVSICIFNIFAGLAVSFFRMAHCLKFYWNKEVTLLLNGLLNNF